MVEFELIYWDRASLIRAILARISHPNKLPIGPHHDSPGCGIPKTSSASPAVVEGALLKRKSYGLG
jgi:hypothetical protein